MDISQFPGQIALVTFPASHAAPRVLLKGVDGILDAYGTVVPVDTTKGYAPGAIFRKIGASPSLSINTGDATSATFKAITHA